MQQLTGQPIPLVDLAAQYRTIGAEIDAAVTRVVRSTAYIHGPFAEAFEQAFASYCGVAHAVGVANGTDALTLALLALEVGPGDEVVTTPFTFTATAEAIIRCGATVRFVDVDPITRNLDAALLPAAISPRTRAILPVHLYGLPADVDAIEAVAAECGVPVVEDAAQAVGARMKGRRAGSLGDIGCFSFYPSKNLGAYGDAGAVVTNRSDLAKKVRMLADHGRTSKYEHGEVGFNSRLDGIQAAVLSVKLPHIEAWNERRNRIAQQFTAALQDISQVRVPRIPSGAYSVYHLYVIEAEHRDDLLTFLTQHGVSAAVHYPIPLHLQLAYAHLGIPAGAYPVAERLARSVLSLPIYPELTDENVERIAGLVRTFYAVGPS